MPSMTSDSPTSNPELIPRRPIPADRAAGGLLGVAIGLDLAAKRNHQTTLAGLAMSRALTDALWIRGPDDKVFRFAIDRARSNGGTDRVTAACAFLSFWARAVLELASSAGAWGRAMERISQGGEHHVISGQWVADLMANPPMHAYIPVEDPILLLWRSRDVLERIHGFEEVVPEAIVALESSPSALPIAVGLAGIAYGRDAIPIAWRQLHEQSVEWVDRIEAIERRLIDAPRLSREAPETSRSHPLVIAEVPFQAGKLGLTLCPGARNVQVGPRRLSRDLVTDIKRIAEWPATDLVCLLANDAVLDLKLDAIQEVAENTGLRWHHLPAMIGSSRKSTVRVDDAKLKQLAVALANGARVVVHDLGWSDELIDFAMRLGVYSCVDPDPAKTRESVIAAVRQAALAFEQSADDEWWTAWRPKGSKSAFAR